jgi:hypothetical protein
MWINFQIDFYDVLMAKAMSEEGRENGSSSDSVRGPSKRSRDPDGADDVRPAKMAKIDAGDVSQILGLCKPEPGLERPIRWKASLYMS